MKEFLLIGFGGMLGSMLRYGSSCLFSSIYPSKFPLSTFFVNCLGCLLIGLIWGYSERSEFFPTELKLFLMLGLLGGFTTFSSYSLEALQLFREGLLLHSLSYIILSVVLGLLFVYFGFRLVS